jgi:hypothetical protein
MSECEKCGHEFDYFDPSATASYYKIELKSEVSHGRTGVLYYCKGCAPFGNTKIPEEI